MTHRQNVEAIIDEENLNALEQCDADEAVKQLENGQRWSDVERRLRNWNHDFLLEARCEGMEANRLEDEYR